GGGVKPAHTHLPAPEALKLMGDAFAGAPTGRVNVHFDVGTPAATWDPGGLAAEYTVPGDLARGGEAIDEASTLCTRLSTDPPWFCQFGRQPTADGLTVGYPGTVGWKTGYQFLRDGLVSADPPPLNADGSDPCDAPGNDGPGQPCERRFDRNRKDIFHYALFAHFVGLPKSDLPCLDSNGVPAQEDPGSGLCSAPLRDNPDFHVPRTNTGIGDYRGADVLLSLGAFSDIYGEPVNDVWTPYPVGTRMNVAGTLMHELGHNVWRRHGGETLEPNCKPTYLSIMNYLYQLRGLLRDDGTSHLDFSGEIVNPSVNETALSDDFVSGSSQPYRLGWYAPITGSYLEGRGTPARKHCDGSDLLETDVPMVRIDARWAAHPIDWNANGTMESAFALDVNFDGRMTASVGGTDPQVLHGSDDWSNLRLNQIGSRRNVGGLYLEDGVWTVGPMSLAVGRGDTGRGDTGRGDTGRGDTGRGDTGRGDTGRGDTGRGDTGRGDTGLGDNGGGDLFANDPNNVGGELDFETATDLAKTPPNAFTACVIGVDCTGVAAPLHGVSLEWAASNLGNVHEYVVYRLPGAELVPDTASAPWAEVGRVQSEPGGTAYSLVDGTQLVDGQQYTYFAVAMYRDEVDAGEFVQSDPSNAVTITAVNDAPTISNIADLTIFANSSTGPLGFTVGDEDVAGVTVFGSSSNTSLVPGANILFGGSGANRTVTVTPAPNQTGTVTITVTAKDGAGSMASDSFVLIVKPLVYDFSGFFSPLKLAGTESAPSDSGTFNYGKAIPIKWRLSLGGTLVTATGSLRALLAVPGDSTGNPACLPNGKPALTLFDPVTGRPAGSSTYRYDATGQQFVFNWDTSATTKQYCYRLLLTLNDDTAAKVTIVRFK
ncbi:MAG: PxKF domain-containing protein, partial [Rhodospirillaceae bacterium]